MGTIFHLATATDWATAQEAGAYTTSTLGRTLAEVGFIHASRGDQWVGVRDRFYAEVDEPLLLLKIDTDRLDVPVVEEAGEPGGRETFPHIYGPVPLDAVVQAIPLSSATDPPPRQSFAAIFLREMFANAALVMLVILACGAGILIGTAFGDAAAPLLGATVGAVLGLVTARRLHLRRRAGD